jgi:VanZ family protein
MHDDGPSVIPTRPSPIAGTRRPLSPAESPPPRWRRWLFDYAPPLVMMLIIFMASTDVGSAGHSGSIIHQLLVWLGLERRLSAAQFEAVNHYVRKLGHLTEYALLAVLLHRAVVSAGVSGRARSAGWMPLRVLTVLALVAFYAATDEFHQRFVASRTPSAWDVLLDATGAGIGLTLKRAWETAWRRRRSG